MKRQERKLGLRGLVLCYSCVASSSSRVRVMEEERLGTGVSLG